MTDCMQAHARAVSEAKQLLQMTPILPEREPKGATLRNDKDLEGFLENHMIFTDISTKEENKVRVSVLTNHPSTLHLPLSSPPPPPPPRTVRWLSVRPAVC